MKQITKKNNSDCLKKWTSAYWTAQARPRNYELI